MDIAIEVISETKLTGVKRFMIHLIRMVNCE